MASASDPTPPSRAAIPYARSVIALEPAQLARMHRAVELLFRIAHSEPYAALVDADAAAVARREPGNTGVFMGYDFHLTEAGPRLIEINTNAGGALLNGLHTAAFFRAHGLAGSCRDPASEGEMRAAVVDTFRAELAAARGPGAALRTLAIADERPDEQFLYAEFELLRDLLEEFGIRAFVCDTGALTPGAGGRLELEGTPIDLVYLRDTDFQLASPRAAPLRAAYLAGAVVVTPTPREHHLLADKRRLAIFSSPEVLARLGVARDDAAFLGDLVPEARLLAAMSREQAWRTRRSWVFKPAAAFGSRAVYRGDKISRRRFEEIYAQAGYVAQRAVAPGAVRVAGGEGPETMKFDVRAYAYRDRVLLLGARVYAGQVTNFRSPGGGFSAICTVREESGPGPGGGPG